MRSAAEDEMVGATARRDQFTTTHWSVVVAAGDTQTPRSTEALESLCRAYWFPLYAYVRRQGTSPEEAEDLPQEFFARLLKNRYLQHAHPEAGRFRTKRSRWRERRPQLGRCANNCSSSVPTGGGCNGPSRRWLTTSNLWTRAFRRRAIAGIKPG